jgi:hypothetical protein
MAQPDFHGARGSNAGDDFHELWALRQSLALLDQESGLTAVTVEGLIQEDESGTPRDTWDGVDCTLYYGRNRPVDAERVVIAQLKYSAADRDQPWTIARLTHTTNKKQDNSVIGRLAKAFAGLKNKRPNLAANGKISVQLVSNQPIDSTVVTALSDPASPERARLREASGLDELDFEIFAKAIDLSECGSGSRFSLEARVLATISDWTDDDARAPVNTLLRASTERCYPRQKASLSHVSP